MNYKKIYEDFIESRKLRPMFESEYYERHHIIPSSFGGSDEDENLIYLTYEEHYFAHLLLAKIHGGKMWYALNCMRIPLGGRNIRNRHMFSVARRMVSHFARDQQEYCFKDIKTGKIFTATREYIQKAYGLDFSKSSRLVNGVTLVSNGICLLANSEKVAKEYVVRGVKDESIYKGSVEELMNLLDVSRISLMNLLNNKSKLLKGKYYLDGALPKEKAKRYKLVNIETGETIHVSSSEMWQRAGMHSSSFSNLVNGVTLKSFGYCLPQNLQMILEPDNTEQICLRHYKTSETVKGSRKYIKELLGVSDNQISNLVNRRCKTMNGYMITE
jgi:hypothetical protein